MPEYPGSEVYEAPAECRIEEIIHEDIVSRDTAAAKAVAEALNMAYSTLMRKANPFDPFAYLRIGHLGPIMRCLGSFRALHYLAAQCGFRCVPLTTTPQPLDETGCFRGLADLTQDLGTVVEKVKNGLADGQLNRHETGDVLRALQELQAGLDRMHAGLVGNGL